MSRLLEERALRWIAKAHHHDKCAVRYNHDCDCGKERLVNDLIASAQKAQPIGCDDHEACEGGPCKEPYL